MSPFCLFTLWVCWWLSSVRAWDYLFISCRFVTFTVTRCAVRVTWKWKQEGFPAAVRGPTKWHIRTEAQKCRIIIPCYPNKTSEKKNRKLFWTAQRKEKWVVFPLFLRCISYFLLNSSLCRTPGDKQGDSTITFVGVALYQKWFCMRYDQRKSINVWLR